MFQIVLVCALYMRAISGVASDREVRFFMDLCQFEEPGGQPYIEIYLALDASSLVYTREDGGGFRGRAEIDLKLETRADSAVLFQDRLPLSTHTLEDTTGTATRFYVLYQVRKRLDPGAYRLVAHATDPAQTGHSYRLLREFRVAQPMSSNNNAEPRVRFSDLQFIENIEASRDASPFQKNGFLIVPFATGDFYRRQDTLSIYAEWYNMDAVTEDPYFMRVYLTEANSTERKPKYTKIFRPRMPLNLDMLTASFDISELPSQTYIAHLELLKNSGERIAHTQRRFYVDNPMQVMSLSDPDVVYNRYYGYPEAELNEYIPALRYISSRTEVQVAKSLKTYQDKKNYFTNFWKKRENDPDDPLKYWRSYHNRYQYANDHFASVHREGWKTDRGRVLLTYGPPNDLQDITGEQDKYPYQIWTYDALGTQQGVIFVFYDRDLITNEYPLLHSTFNAEVYNPNWRANLMKNRQQLYHMDDMRNSNPNFRDWVPNASGSPDR